ncbi:hypothetical protein [Pseudonocardia asaccharolytica]|uniref:Uncharacterized protein n=1 Tax=Pseudonocardia asaccharolytica DSM 44247 = NBRC 16224 TaxID=1123024 RepID=A0A511D6R9_9PSEU|nr:hypothetical protein [Pseudonocardia asaccharolytica]GEL19304.1 hypothetical protein PA7_31410 [Pseudonocardia asaccharolytica DSM 44247 = NBRC 16224]
MPAVFVCGPDNRNLRKRYWRCPSCERITETVVRHGGWWGVDILCCRCGDRWTDGQLRPRPFQRGWRDERRRRHRQLWDAATHGPDPTFEELFPEYAARRPVVDVHLPDDEETP